MVGVKSRILIAYKRKVWHYVGLATSTIRRKKSCHFQLCLEFSSKYLSFSNFDYILGKLYNFTIYDRFCRSFLGFTRLKLIELIWNMLPLLRLNNGFCFDLVHSWFFWTDLTQTERYFERHKNLTILTKSCTINYQRVKLSLLDNL